MKINRTKNAINGSLWGIVNRFVCTIVPFAIRTIIIREFGEEYAGLNSLFTAILQVLNLSELGITSAIVYSLYRPIAEDNYEEINGLICFYRKVYFYIGLVIFVLGIGCIPFLPDLINGEYPDEVNIYILYLIFLTNTCISYFFFAYKEAVLTAYQRIDLLNIVKLCMIVIQYVLQIFILMKFHNYYLYCGVLMVCTFFRGFINYLLANRYFPQIKCCGTVDKLHRAHIRKNMLGIALGKICTVSRGACDNIIISAFISLSMLAVFDNYYYVMSAAMAFLNVIETAMVSGVGNSLVTENENKNYHDFSRINYLFMVLCGICVSVLVCVYQPFMSRWVGSGLMLPTSTMILFCVYFYISCMSTIPSVYLTALGMWWNMKLKSLVEVVLNLSLNIVLVKRFGIAGILSATILTLFFISFMWGSAILYSYYYKGRSLCVFWIRQLIYGIVAAIASFLAYEICQVLNLGEDNICILLRCAIACVVPILLFSLLYCKNKIAVESFHFVKEVVKHKLNIKNNCQ